MSKNLKKSEKGSNINETFSYGIIYIYSIPDKKHTGRLKIGSATIISSNPTQENIDSAAHDRIKQQTKTADIPYLLEHAELAVTNDGKYFSDYDVHEVLKRSGYERKAESVKNPHSEWFELSLEVAKNAIQATKEGRTALSTKERVSIKISEFPFRPNQLEAIDKTTKAIKRNRKHFLWNAKMRFGKTSAAMQVAKENKMKKVLIVTHRPSVSIDWYDDFNKVLASANYEYSSKTKGENINTLINGDKAFVYFASLQDLRLSKRVVDDESSGSHAGGFTKNDEVFDTMWDMLIVDEAHEGTQSILGDATFSKIPANFTLLLSGTPFNILDKREEEDIYTWDYVMEQEAKLNWDEQNPGVPNPYAELPALSIFTYDIDTFENNIGSFDKNFKDELDGAFKFHEFFRVHKDDEGNDTAEFVHVVMVKKFLDLLVDNTLDTKFPYVTEEYRNYNKHSLWLLPNRVKVIEAMEKLLKIHSVFGSGNFGIVNISGDSRDDEEDKDAKERVTKAIKNHDYTITLTGQRLTTGASIPEWTAVFMMSDTNSATTYLQTAFRCQTPARIDGKFKTQGYVFDFAPDRTLKLVAEAIELNHKSGKTNSPEQKDAMREFLNFCPILAAKGGAMKPYDVEAMLGQLKKAIIERVSRNGFDDPKLYNDELLKLNEMDVSKFNELKAIIGTSSSDRVNEIKINELGMDDLKTQKAAEAELKKKQKIELSQEEKEALKKLKEAREQKKNAINILRAVSVRMPMLVYGADVSVREDITLQKFINLVDEDSWQEFMPAGLSKEKFKEFTKYYDEDVFKGVAHSIRAKAFDCDDLLPTERIQAIAEIFKTFKNPDKETVLTPWNVVNIHITKAFGGHDFTSGGTDKTREKPEWKSYDVDTSIWTQDDTKILEINSKSGLYPLLATYNIYSRKLKKEKGKNSEEKLSRQIWNKVLANNIYVLCKSPMAKSITFRTLAGYNKGVKTNIIYIEDLIKKLQQKENYKDYNLKVELLEKFNLTNKNMKFTAVVGNPPYQVTTDTNFATPVYHLFFEAAKNLNPDYISLIQPARFLFNAGATPKEWNKQMLNDSHLSVPLYEPNSQKIFSGVDIKGGICVTLWNKNNSGGGLGGSFVAHDELGMIIDRVGSGSFNKLVGIKGDTKLRISLDPKYPDEQRIASNYFERFPDVFLSKRVRQNDVEIIGLEKGNKRTSRFVKNDIIFDSKLDNWKILIPESNGSGLFGEILSNPMLVGPQVGCTYTFLQIGPFDSKKEAQNCLNYIKTKFFRALLGTLKTTQHNPSKVWANIPIQNFKNTSDIDWSKSIPEIDKQLYAKYGLDKKEVTFIETRVKPMA
ncbi:Eco57I restriction-modification methylase domain-containing protein [Candidatus Falkowbacteria bacterium]|nr:MAG: Eco57I restriction-modification methylase domain-containing protein [Candidatus Falkowbacteria bacterium]